MSALPEVLIKPNKYNDVELQKHKHFGDQVEEVEVNEDENHLIVKRRNAVAMADMSYDPSTKILMQFQKRFRQPCIGQVGFTMTDLPIRQIHYPGCDENRKTTDDRGILLSYTWCQDALIFGTQSHDQTNPDLAILRHRRNLIILRILQAKQSHGQNGWVQGALMSGLYVALKLDTYLEENSEPLTKKKNRESNTKHAIRRFRLDSVTWLLYSDKVELFDID
ncbi:hypothetical protein CHS0354_012234 [Potamilus streckersoni]|uniref:Uncharacterized protein n=1 Tax=Potamilus streckersoni TaxID=2493646 RepID=A0AAE0SAL4_9BIVA|nr:hypothetical protein CHS0354_012234 [Potamilus streckersoni]